MDNISIYKITCETGKIYYGSTKRTLEQRFKEHYKGGSMCNCKDFINPTIDLIETCNEEERKDIESYYIRNYECVNLYVPNRTKKERQKNRNEKTKIWLKNNPEYRKEYQQKNKEKIKIWKTEYEKLNKEKIEKRRGAKYTCECGSVVRKDSKSRHEKTKKHLGF